MDFRSLIDYLRKLRKKTKEVFISREEDGQRIKELDECLKDLERSLSKEHLEKIKKQIQEETDY